MPSLSLFSKHRKIAAVDSAQRLHDAPPNPSPTPRTLTFTDLPSELRLLIFSFCDLRLIYGKPHRKWNSQSSPPLIIALRPQQHPYAEALVFFYQTNRFFLYKSSFFLGYLKPEVVAMIKNIEIPLQSYFTKWESCPTLKSRISIAKREFAISCNTSLVPERFTFPALTNMRVTLDLDLFADRQLRDSGHNLSEYLRGFTALERLTVVFFTDQYWMHSWHRRSLRLVLRLDMQMQRFGVVAERESLQSRVFEEGRYR